MIIGIDFDGTVVEHEFPKIGNEVPGAVATMKALINNGHKLVLFTMRCDHTDDHILQSNDPNIILSKGQYLTEAVCWFKDRGIELYGVQRNPDQNWTTSPKAYVELMIDDNGLGCPLQYYKHKRPHVQWQQAAWMLYMQDLITESQLRVLSASAKNEVLELEA